MSKWTFGSLVRQYVEVKKRCDTGGTVGEGGILQSQVQRMCAKWPKNKTQHSAIGKQSGATLGENKNLEMMFFIL